MRERIVDDLRLEPEDLADPVGGHDVSGRAGDDLALLERDEIVGVGPATLRSWSTMTIVASRAALRLRTGVEDLDLVSHVEERGGLVEQEQEQVGLWARAIAVQTPDRCRLRRKLASLWK